MQADQALRLLIAHSGRSGRAVSVDLGHVPTWASVSTQPGRVPKLDTLADVADVAGVDVVLRDRATGEELGTIEPPRRSRQGERGDAARGEPSD